MDQDQKTQQPQQDQIYQTLPPPRSAKGVS